MKLTSFWQLLALITVLTWIVYTIQPGADHWLNLRLIPYKTLVVLWSVYLAHKIDWFFFKEPDAGDTLARAIVYGATVIGMALAL